MQAKENILGKGIVLIAISISIQSCANETKIDTPSPAMTTAYPEHRCNTKPAKPKKPGKISSYKNIETYNLTISKYNLSVEKYNNEINTYRTCINNYIKKGNKDINKIRKQLNKALKEARTY